MIADVVTIDALDAGRRRAMLCLLDRCFWGVSAETFAADLKDKTHAILLTDAAGRLVGFSTLALYTAAGPDGDACPITVVCSGDTVVVPEAWGSWALPRAWINAVYRLGHARHRGPDDQSSGGRLYWLLICSGYRTYRFLPLFMGCFVAGPVTDKADPMQRLARRLARERWGDRFDAAAGVVRLDHPQPLRPDLVEVSPGRAGQRDVAAFLRMNPGHAAGDELVCLARLDREHLTRAGRRMLDADRNGAAR